MLQHAGSKNLNKVIVLEDIASGLNENRRNSLRLLELVTQRRIEVVYLSFKDRLARFRSRYLELFFSCCGCGVETLNTETKASKRQLVEHLAAIVTSFAGRI